VTQIKNQKLPGAISEATVCSRRTMAI